MKGQLARLVALILMTPVTAGGVALAQAPRDSIPIDSLKRGDHLRVWMESPPVSGLEVDFRRIDERALVVSGSRALDRFTGSRSDIPLESLRRLEVGRGRTTTAGYVSRRALVGALCGALVGGAVGYMGDSQSLHSEGEGVLAFTPLGGIAGLLVGTVVGLRGHPRWVPVALPDHGHSRLRRLK